MRKVQINQGSLKLCFNVMALTIVSVDEVIASEFTRLTSHLQLSNRDLLIVLGLVFILLLLTFISLVRAKNKTSRALTQAKLDAQNLRVSNEKLAYMLSASPIVLFSMQVNEHSLIANWVSENVSRITGYSPEAVLHSDWWMKNLYQTDRERIQKESHALFVGKHTIYEYRFVHANGSIIWIRDERKLVCDDLGNPKEVLVAWMDISERKLEEINLRIAAKAFETQDGIIISDKDNRIIKVNTAFSKMTGYSADEVIGKVPDFLKSNRHSSEFYEGIRKILLDEHHWEGEMWNRRKDGSVYPEWLTINTVKDDMGNTSHYVATFFDMTERKAAEDSIRNLAYYDPLTGLPNRLLMLDRLGIAITNSHRSNHHGSLMFLDLDRFKVLNDTQGHEKGDQLLVQVAKRLQACVREGDTVARLGGDEFVVMLENLSSDGTEAAIQAQAVAEKMHLSLAEPYLLPTLNNEGDNLHFEHHSSASIGMVIFLGNTIHSEDLLKRADLAMYQAKHAGGDAIRVFDPVMQTALNERTALEIDLRQALSQGQFTLYYQVQVDINEHAVGAEALIRWHHPERGLVLPDQFITVAEETGLIVPIGLWALRQGCLTLVKWVNDPLTQHLKLAINVSPRQFRQKDFVAQVEKVLLETGVNPKLLKLEITESLIMDNLDETIEKMFEIKAFGVGFAMDDFGTGYSSLANLQKLPLDQLKVDRGFVSDLAESRHDAAIIRSIVTLGRTLGLTVIAEGIETSIQRDYLSAFGCPIFQGFYFAKPLTLEVFESNLASHRDQ